MPIPFIDALIVEDNRALSGLLVAVLQSKGMSTDVAGDVVEAKRLLARHNYRVILLDLILPDGSGIDVLDFMKSENLPKADVIVMTAAEASQLGGLDRSMVSSIFFKPI